MQRQGIAVLLAATWAWGGCAFAPPDGAPLPVPVQYDNPCLIIATDHELVWDQVTDVVSGFFRIENEQRVQIVGNVITEGRVDTYPQGGATLLEPQRADSVGSYNRWESTLQTIRRQGHIRVMPAQGGFLVEVIVEKELEDLPGPAEATAGAATFHLGITPHDPRPNAKRPAPAPGWIPLGRDIALEQRILAELQARLGGPPPGVAY